MREPQQIQNVRLHDEQAITSPLPRQRRPDPQGLSRPWEGKPMEIAAGDMATARVDQSASGQREVRAHPFAVSEGSTARRSGKHPVKIPPQTCSAGIPPGDPQVDGGSRDRAHDSRSLRTCVDRGALLRETAGQPSPLSEQHSALTRFMA